MTISPAQIRAARGLLNWTSKTLAEKVGVKPSSMSLIENSLSKGSTHTMELIEKVFCMAGIEFTPNGVTQRDVLMYRLDGTEGFRKMMEDVYHAAQDASDICIFGGSPDTFIKWLGDDFYAGHKKRMQEVVAPYKVRVIIGEGNYNLIGKGFADYRWSPSKLFGDKVLYVFGDSVAFIGFENATVEIQVINQKETAAIMRNLFNIVWDYAAKEIPN